MDINALPEGCIATAISLTDPRDSCRLALVNSAFRSAFQSDTVWERFLPPDYFDIIGRSTANLDIIRSFTSKKELFLYLCDHHFIFDDGKKSIWLDKMSGKKCYMLSSRDLNIAYGDNPQYWEWINLPGSRFQEVAKLLDISWLEICGKITTDMLSPNTTYVAYLIFPTNSKLCGFGHPHAEARIGINGQDSKKSSVCLDPIGAREREQRPLLREFWWFHSMPVCTGYPLVFKMDADVQCSSRRDDSRSEIELGEFHVEDNKEVMKLEISLKEIKGGNRMSGLIIEGIEIRPKRVKRI